MGWFMKYYLVPDWALHSAPNSAPYSKIWKVTVLVSSLRTTDHAINLTQDTLHPFFIKKKNALSIAEPLKCQLFTTFILVF